MTQLDPVLRWLPAVLPQPDEQARQQALARWDALLKPRGSLGRLETLVAHLAAVQGRVPPACEKPLVLVMAGDHGVVEEGVSAYPQEVTRLAENTRSIARLVVFPPSQRPFCPFGHFPPTRRQGP